MPKGKIIVKIEGREDLEFEFDDAHYDYSREYDESIGMIENHELPLVIKTPNGQRRMLIMAWKGCRSYAEMSGKRVTNEEWEEYEKTHSNT